MTRNIWTLLRMNSIMSWRAFREKTGSGRPRFGILLLPLLALAFLPLLITVTGTYIALYAAGKALGQGEVLLVLVISIGQLACLTFGVFYVISAFYYSRDLHILVPMPLRPGEIVLSKFIAILLGEYLTMTPLVLPGLAVYGVFAQVNVLYIPFALVIFLLMPVIPLVLASLFSIALMRITNLRRNRDLWRVLGALAGILIALGFNVFSRYSNKGSFGPTAQSMEQLLVTQKALFESLGKYVPTSIWAANALRAGAPGLGLGPFLLFTLVALAALLALLWVAEKLFFSGLIGGDETRAPSRVLSRDQLHREAGQASTPLWALVQREIRLLNRTPSFLMAGLTPFLVMPFFIALPLIQGQHIGKLMDVSGRLAQSPLVPVIGMAAVLFMNSISNIPPTAISREGRFFWISRSLPVAPRLQIQAKMLHAGIFSTFSVLLVTGAMLYLRVLQPLGLVYLVLGAVAICMTSNYSGIILDLMHPNLKWTDPQQAMKGNLSGLFNMLLMLVLGVVGALLAVLLYLFARPVMVPGLILAFGLAGFLLAKIAGNLAEKRYLEYED